MEKVERELLLLLEEMQHENTTSFVTINPLTRDTNKVERLEWELLLSQEFQHENMAIYLTFNSYPRVNGT